MAETAQKRAPTEAPYTLPSIVLIEDDVEVSRSLAMLLRSRGSTVQVYPDGRKFLFNHMAHSGHCILADYKMPRLDGLELIRRLRALGDMTPAIMMTGFYSNTLRQRALDAGYSDVLEKPTPAEILIDRIVSIT
ncbi:MAG: response regulator [Henriciella sp.]|nr:response regulator [Henriciella sp.]